MRKAWEAIEPFARPVLTSIAMVLACVGLPLALLIALIFHHQFFSSTRPGKFGLEDIIGRFMLLALICGVAALVLIGILGLIFANLP
jgi:hypothetical protein